MLKSNKIKNCGIKLIVRITLSCMRSGILYINKTSTVSYLVRIRLILLVILYHSVCYL